MNYEKILSALLVTAICAGGMTCTLAQSLAKPQELHLDAPVNDENSVRVDFGGAVLRVPKFLIDPRSIPANPKKSIQMDSIGFTFWYPDMTLTCFGRACNSSDLDSDSDFNAQFDERFKIYVSSLIYSSQDRHMKIPRPSEIFLRKEDEVGPAKVRSSGLQGLNTVDYSESFLKKHPDWPSAKSIVSQDGALYMNSKESEYELWMPCDDSQCRGVMYQKDHHFLVRFIISRPTKAVIGHAEEFIKKFNSVLDGWKSK